MNNKTQLIHQRNKYLSILLWITLIPALNNQIKMGIPVSAMIFIDTFVVGPAIIGTISVLKKKFSTFAMYAIGIGGAIGFLGGMIDTHLYATMFIGIILISLYQEWKVILLNSIIMIIGFNFHFKQYVHIENTNQLVVLHIMLTIAIVTLILFSISTEKIRKTFVKNNEELEISKGNAEVALEDTKKSEDKINHFTDVLNKNINQTKDISKEIATSFREITRGIETQAYNINAVNDNLKNIGEVIDEIAVNSKEMSNSSTDTEKIATKYNDEIKKLSSEMEKVEGSIESAIQLITELNEKNKKINNVLNTLNELTNQTSLLSLNASIEAARAGEHGKGFMIVANEVKKLAENSQDSSEEIANILKEIQTKSFEVTKQVEEGISIINESRKTLSNSEETFQQVNKNAKNITEQANENEAIVINLKSSTEKIIREMNSIASISEQFTSSIEEISSSVSNQSNHLEEITNSFSQIKK
jgi:methyl-accepting chemotaxis protein